MKLRPCVLSLCNVMVSERKSWLILLTEMPWNALNNNNTWKWVFEKEPAMITVCLVFIREPTLYKKKWEGGGFNLTLCHEHREIIHKTTVSIFLFSFGDIFDIKPKSTVVCLNHTLEQSFLWRKYGSLLLIYSVMLVSQALSAAQCKLPESRCW